MLSNGAHGLLELVVFVLKDIPKNRPSHTYVLAKFIDLVLSLDLVLDNIGGDSVIGLIRWLP